MLTVKEINEVSFGKAGFSGYKPEDVDNFIDEVADSFRQLELERDDALKQAQDLAAQNSALSAKNAEIQEKLAILAQKIESYRAEEDQIKDALLSAQKLGRDSLREAKDKAEIILQDAKDSAQQMMENAKVEANKAAKEYMAQADEKKEELEEMKRQVSAFRASLMEMYKKHLECIDHIPNFKPKDKPEEPQEKPEPPVHQEAAPASAAPEQPVQPAPAPAKKAEPQSAPVRAESTPAPMPAPAPAPAPVRREEPRPQPTLHDRVDFTRDQPQFVQTVEDGELPEEEDLSDVGIDVKAYNNIPESLRREKSSHFSNLEFGEDVDLGNKKRKK